MNLDIQTYKAHDLTAHQPTNDTFFFAKQHSGGAQTQKFFFKASRVLATPIAQYSLFSNVSSTRDLLHSPMKPILEHDFTRNHFPALSAHEEPSQSVLITQSF